MIVPESYFLLRLFRPGPFRRRVLSGVGSSLDSAAGCLVKSSLAERKISRKKKKAEKV
jgi:hypothetical protein